MTLPDDLFVPASPANPGAPPQRVCRRHDWYEDVTVGSIEPVYRCRRCRRIRDAVMVRRGKNNRSRGNRAELDVAREVGGRKVGPLGHPWDVEVTGYARLQVKKLLRPPSLKAIGQSLTFGTGEMMAGYVWIEPGHGGERLIVFRLKDFGERHGIEVEE